MDGLLYARRNCGTERYKTKKLDDALKDTSGFGNLAKSAKPFASHATDFDPPIYNIWKQREKIAGKVGDLAHEAGHN